MIPKEKVEAIVSKHNSIEKELSSGNVDPKSFAESQKNMPILVSYLKMLSVILVIVMKKQILKIL